MSAGDPFLATDAEIAAELGDLLARQVLAKPGHFAPPEPPLVAATFVDDNGKLGGLCTMDLPLAASLGAALTMAPPAAVNDAIRARALPELLAENVGEVFNIGSRWFMTRESAPHVRLRKVYQVELPENLHKIIASAPRRRFAKLEIAGYLGGVLALYAPPISRS